MSIHSTATPSTELPSRKRTFETGCRTMPNNALQADALALLGFPCLSLRPRHNKAFVPTPRTADRFLELRWRRGTTTR